MGVVVCSMGSGSMAVEQTELRSEGRLNRHLTGDMIELHWIQIKNKQVGRE
jgi:hypothetical protein